MQANAESGRIFQRMGTAKYDWQLPYKSKAVWPSNLALLPRIAGVIKFISNSLSTKN